MLFNDRLGMIMTLETEEFENKLCYVYFNKDNTLSLLDKERSTAVDT